MAFSFRAGTNWCHDFPKLARESGFYFNMHRTRVRVDWNRISMYLILMIFFYYYYVIIN